LQQRYNDIMTDIAITLNIPQSLYHRAQRLSEARDLPIEQVILNQLEASMVEIPKLPPDEQAELDALTHLSDEALWTIAREQMQPERQARMQILMNRNNFGTITDDEHGELTQLVDQGQRLMLRKGKAMALLTERGHTIHSEDL
jgi:hypothetical protein